MDKKAFAELVSSVQDMGRHMRGEKVARARITKVREPNVRTIRRKSGLSQSQFAVLIGVNLRTLQNWEQGRTRPTGPARALLRIVEKNPKAMLTLHAA
ncbi:MAG: helix-turn-helix domain-containing protein [Sulfuricaulis sp.]|uniref:helix-turn-helix domain-containing protein n=1 Tax=Sulfuricaulis sp. TaxID=2003553 RepID=UPI0034A2D392